MKRIILLSALLMLITGSISAKTPKITTNYRNALIFAYAAVNNVYEDDNIKLEIYNESLWATNKTQKTIFIDLSQCFLYHNGVSRPMFSKNLKDNYASKKGTSTSVDEFITVSPSTGNKQNVTFICDMSSGFYGKYSTSESPNGDFTEYEKGLLNLVGEMVVESMQADPKGKDCKGTVSRHLTEDESVNTIGVSIAYASNKRAEEWTNVSLSNWVSDVIFAPYFVQMPDDLTKKNKKGFGIKESKPALIHIKANTPFEFDEDKSPLIVADWSGNFKKGTFKLTTTKISKTKSPNIALVMLAGPAVLAATSEQFYKSILHFDGENADWGEMIFSPVQNSEKLSQSVK